MSKKSENQKSAPKLYEVVKGCDTADGTRYEPGDSYLPELHAKETTKELLDAGAIKEN